MLFKAFMTWALGTSGEQPCTGSSTSRILIFVLAFVINLMIQSVKWIERRRLNWSEKFKKVPTEKWNNQWPIVLVYGLSGSIEDQAPIFGSTFGNILRACEDGYKGNVYLANTGSISSIHDRACELY